MPVCPFRWLGWLSGEDPLFDSGLTRVDHTVAGRGEGRRQGPAAEQPQEGDRVERHHEARGQVGPLPSCGWLSRGDAWARQRSNTVHAQTIEIKNILQNV